MKIGIIGPSKLKNFYQIEEVAKIVAEKKHEVVFTPDKGSTSEHFAKKYLEAGGKKVFVIIPLDDKEFGNSWVNQEVGEVINCGVWRNQPEKLNEECGAIISLGYSAGGLAEIAYSKWFPKDKPQKPIYIVEELISQKLPIELEESLDLRYISINELGKILEIVS